MEKFSQWRDPATGIAPFIQANDKKPVWRLFLGIIRVIFLLPLSLLLASTGKLAALIDLRLINVKFSVEYSIAENKWRSKGQIPVPGDVIISNFTSPADSSIFTAVYGGCMFGVPSDGGLLAILTAKQVRKIALKSPSEIEKVLKSKKSHSLSDLCVLGKKNGKILVILPEKTTSNNKGLLKLSEVSFENLPETSRIYPAGLRYVPSSICAPLPVKSWVWWWNSVSSSTYNARLRVQKPLNVSDFTMNSIAGKICDAARITQVGYGFHDKQEFLHAWAKLKR